MSGQEDAQDELMENYGFIYGDVYIPYRVRRVKMVPSKVRKIQIQVPPDAQVIVDVPEDAQRSDIHDTVMKRARWIYNHWESFHAQREHIQTRRYVSGEMQFYLGGRYVLKVNEEAGRRLDTLLPQARWVNTKPDYRILAMEKQWGSCSASGTLMLNPHLVKAPHDCIDYVILHELCHIEEHNHSERFYRLLTQAMPEWKSVKQRLDGIAELLLNE